MRSCEVIVGIFLLFREVSALAASLHATDSPRLVALPCTLSSTMSDKVTRRDSLRKVPFGRTGWEVTEVCGGTMTWGSFNGKEEEAHEQLDKLIELGVNFLDTAELYPVAFNYGKKTEEWIGNWLTKRTAEGKVDRSKLYIATKVNASGMGGTRGDGSKEAPWQKHGYEDEIVEASCRASLERLKCGVGYCKEVGFGAYPALGYAHAVDTASGAIQAYISAQSERGGKCGGPLDKTKEQSGGGGTAKKSRWRVSVKGRRAVAVVGGWGRLAPR